MAKILYLKKFRCHHMEVVPRPHCSLCLAGISWSLGCPDAGFVSIGWPCSGPVCLAGAGGRSPRGNAVPGAERVAG